MRLALPLLLALLLAVPAAAQVSAPGDAYLDARAGELVRLARARRALDHARITGYQTTARERISIRAAMAGAERLVFRREIAARIDWSRDTVRIDVLGAREAQPLVAAAAQLPGTSLPGEVPALAFDPVDSEMLLPVDSAVLRHPLAPGSEASYRFASGDSSSITLPGGRVVRLQELRITARRADPTLINGSFWLDAESHSVVRAGFRLSRGFSATPSGLSFLTPDARGELDYVAVEYALWELRWWLPRSLVARGVATAAGLRFPIAYERSYDDYTVQGDSLASPVGPPAPLCRPRRYGSVSISLGGGGTRDSAWEAGFDQDAARRAAGQELDGGEASSCARPYLVTRDPATDLLAGPAFSASIYDAGEGGAMSDAEREQLAELLHSIPPLAWEISPPSIQLLTADLARVNRVEGVSLGARAILPLGPAELRAELRAGTTGEVGARLSGIHDTPAVRREVALYRGLDAVDLASQPFSLGSSAGALLLGRDENDYFRATGAELRLLPAAARPQRWELRLFTERQEPVRARSDFSLRGLFDGSDPRPNLAADRIDQLGGTLRLRGALGDDPARLRTRAELELHAETGDRTFARPLLRLGADRLLGGGVGVGLGLTAGTGVGDVPAQRAWQIGGATTVRGHDAAALRGESVWLARGEVSWGLPIARLALFGDAGWAGPRDDLWSARPLRAAGLGVSLLDNLLRIDLARGIGGGGLRLHLRMGGGL